MANDYIFLSFNTYKEVIEFIKKNFTKMKNDIKRMISVHKDGSNYEVVIKGTTKYKTDLQKLTATTDDAAKNFLGEFSTVTPANVTEMYNKIKNKIYPFGPRTNS